MADLELSDPDRGHLVVGDGAILALWGAAGTGKTTLLREISGLDAPRDALRTTLRVGGRDVGAAPPSTRGVALVHGGATLSRRLTVREHLDLVARDGIEESAAAVGLTALHRRIDTLNQFERQLVALARAVAVRPGVLLLDEPTLGLRADDVVAWRARVAALGLTTVWATRELGVVVEVAQRVAVLAAGRVVRVDDGATLRARPPSVAVALALEPGLIALRVRPGATWLPMPVTTPPGDVRVLVRRVRLAEEGVPGRVLAADGPTVFVAVAGLPEPLPAHVGAAALQHVGHRVHVRAEPSDVLVFDAVTGERLDR